MHRRTLLLMLVCAVAAITTATAQEVNARVTSEPNAGLAAPVDDLVPSTSDLVPRTQEIAGTLPPVVGDATGLVEETSGVALPLDTLTALTERAHGEVSVVGSEAPVKSEPSFADQAAAVAVPAAGSALVAITLGALALGGEGLRLVQARIVGGMVRALRAAAGLLVFIPLFSRIERGAVMDNAQRARVHEVVAQDPGLSLSEVTARAGIAWGTAVHHLRRLEQHGMVVSVRELGHRRFFIANTPAAAQRSALSVVMHPTARRIAEFVAHRPGTNQAGICQALGLNNPAASKHLSHFEQRGLVVAQRSGNSRHYHPTGGLHSALLLLEPSPVLSTPRPAARASPPMVVA